VLSSRRPAGSIANMQLSGSGSGGHKSAGGGGSPSLAGSAAGGAGGAAAAAAAAAQLEAAHVRIGELTNQMADARLSVESLEKERDFYFGKLRDVEILLQSYSGPDRPTVDALFKILYATDDADFVAVEGGAPVA
jgi:RP/EB family microtubule-associated protein